MKRVYSILGISLILVVCLVLIIAKQGQDSRLIETRKSKGGQGPKLIETRKAEDENFNLTIEHFYDEELLAEYWITTITPEDKQSLRTLVNKSFAKTESGKFNTFAKENPLDHAKRVKSIFAINASAWTDNRYSFGVHIKDGIVYQNSSSLGRRGYTLGIDDNGIMNVFPGTITGKELVSKYKIANTFTFSIPIIINGKEVGQEIYDHYSSGYSKADPRQIIGQVKDTHEIIILTVDGRTEKSQGLTLPQAARILIDRNVRVAYNLDGGGSVQTIFEGKVINHPSDGKMRPTTDLLYFK